VIWATDTLKEDMQRRCDCWGDSWTQAVDENSLLQLLENMSVPDDDLSMDVSTMVENCPELKEIDYGGLFRGWRIVVKDFKVGWFLLYFIAILETGDSIFVIRMLQLF